MGGITRLLSSIKGREDDLMDLMPTFVAESTTNQVHRGFHVIPYPKPQPLNSKP